MSVLLIGAEKRLNSMIRSLIRRRTLNCAGIHNNALGMTAGKIIQNISNPLFDETAFCSKGLFIPGMPGSAMECLSAHR